MSLKVWLPLNGNLNNQGLSNLTFSNSNTSIETSGKIGSCYYFDGISSRLFCQEVNWTYPLSICGWFYPMNTAGTTTQYFISYNKDAGGSNGHVIGVGTLNGGSALNIWAGGSSIPTNIVLTDNVWYHLAVTIDKNKNYKLYVNGEMVKNGTCGENPGANWITIGARSNSASGAGVSASYYFKGKMNDVRVYNECLSLKQIKEIAKGLVCHYKFDGIKANENFILRSDKVTSSGGATGITRTITDGILKVEAAEGNGNWCTVGFAANSNTNVGEKMSVGDSYTVSCDIMIESGNNFPTLFINNGNGYRRLGGGDITKLNEWQRVYYSNTWNEPGTQYGNISLHLGFSGLIGTYYFKNFKLEKGNFTKWIPAPTDPEYIAWGYDKIFKQDCSGFNYNATKVGTLTFNSDSPRYDGSTYFNGSSYLQTISPSAEARTISLWAKWDSIPSGQSVVYVDYKSRIGLGLMSSGILCSSGGVSSKTFSKTNIVANTWYHFVIVNPGDANTSTDRDLYINGVKQTPTTNTSNWTFSIDYLQIGKRSTTSDGFIGQISDFRIYATALSAEEILTLYKNSGIIDNNGNVYTREFKEV